MSIEKATFRHVRKISEDINLQIDFTLVVDNPEKNDTLHDIALVEISKCLNHYFDDEEYIDIKNVSYYWMPDDSDKWYKEHAKCFSFNLIKK